MRKSSLKLRSARGSRRAEGEAVGASDEANATEGGGFDSSDESPSPRRESFLAPLRTRLADTAAFERELRGSRTTEKRAVERDPRRDTRTRPHVSNVLDPAREASETPTRDGEKDGADGATTLDVARDVEIVSNAKPRPTTPTTPTGEEEEGKEKEEDEEEEEEKRRFAAPGVFHTTLRDARRAGRSRRRSRESRSETFDAAAEDTRVVRERFDPRSAIRDAARAASEEGPAAGLARRSKDRHRGGSRRGRASRGHEP